MSFNMLKRRDFVMNKIWIYIRTRYNANYIISSENNTNKIYF